MHCLVHPRTHDNFLNPTLENSSIEMVKIIGFGRKTALQDTASLPLHA